MIEGLRPYADMKPSGLPWLGDVPAHWDVTRLRNLSTRVTSGSRGWSRYMADSGPIFVRIGNLTRTGIDLRLANAAKLDLPENVRGECCRTQILPSDLLISITAWIGSVAVVPAAIGEAYVSQHVSACRLRANEILSRWAAYVVASPIGQAHGTMVMNGGTKQGLSLDDVKNYPVLLPPLDEQRLIVRFLDWHGAQTLRLVRAKKKIIALLNEQKQAIIHRAVTRGLDPNAKLKPSGIPWLGDVPEGWEIRALKRTSRRSALYGANIPSERYAPKGVRFLRTTDISDTGELRPNGVFISEAVADGYVLADGDFVISRSGTVGRAFVYQESIHGPCAYAGYLVRFILNQSNLLPEYLWFLTKAPFFQSFLKSVSITSTIENVNGDKYANMPIALPPIGEQAEILAAVQSKTAPLDTIMKRLEAEIGLFREFRTRLIADVVTGKLDVRAFAVSLPETIELDAIDDLTEGDDLDEASDAPENEEVAA